MHTEDRPAWYTHTSRVGILTVEDLSAKTCGIRYEKEYNDWDGIYELVNLPDHAVEMSTELFPMSLRGRPKTLSLRLSPLLLYANDPDRTRIDEEGRC
jgi:hypothetical protein